MSNNFVALIVVMVTWVCVDYESSKCVGGIYANVSL